jgi:hypothetical protein
MQAFVYHNDEVTLIFPVDHLFPGFCQRPKELRSPRFGFGFA